MSEENKPTGEKPLAFPNWDSNNVASSLDKVYNWTVQVVEQQIKWYEDSRMSKKRGSQWIRGLSISLAAIGGLCPLVESMKLFGSGVSLSQWGYVILGIAASLYAYDRFFGFSSGWMRYMIAEISLRRILKEFKFDWATLTAQNRGNPPDPVVYIQKAKEFSLRAEDIVKQETEAWIVEFQKDIAELEKQLKEEKESRKK